MRDPELAAAAHVIETAFPGVRLLKVRPNRRTVDDWQAKHGIDPAAPDPAVMHRRPGEPYRYVDQHTATIRQTWAQTWIVCKSHGGSRLTDDTPPACPHCVQDQARAHEARRNGDRSAKWTRPVWWAARPLECVRHGVKFAEVEPGQVECPKCLIERAAQAPQEPPGAPEPERRTDGPPAPLRPAGAAQEPGIAPGRIGGSPRCGRHGTPYVLLTPAEHCELIPGSNPPKWKYTGRTRIYCVNCYREDMNARGLANYPPPKLAAEASLSPVAAKPQKPRLPAALDLNGLYLPGGRLAPVAGRTAATIAPEAAELGVRDVFLTAHMVEALGLSPARTYREASGSAFLEPAAGWTVTPDRLVSMAVCHQEGSRLVVRFHLVSDLAGSRLESLAVAADGPELLGLMLRFEQLTGARWDGSASQTTAHLRRELARNAAGMSPDAYDPRETLPPALVRGVGRPPGWYRPLRLELAERFPYVIRLDKRAAYLAAFSSDLAAKAPHHQGARPLGELGRAGWALVQASPWPDPESFDPLGAMRARTVEGSGGAFWADLHSLRYAERCGVCVEVLDSWTFGEARRFLGEAPPPNTRGVMGRLAEALEGLEESGLEREALRPLIKAMYSEFVGWLASGYHEAGEVLWRPEWRDAIIANTTVALHRLSLRAPGRAVAALGIDSLGVLLETDEPEGAAELLGVQLGERLGQFHAEAGWPSRLQVLDGLEPGLEGLEATRTVRRQVLTWKRERAGGDR